MHCSENSSYLKINHYLQKYSFPRDIFLSDELQEEDSLAWWKYRFAGMREKTPDTC